MYNFRRSATNKPLHQLLLETHTLVLLIEIYWQSCMSSFSNQYVGERELEETIRTCTRVQCFLKSLFRPICLQMRLLFSFFPDFLSCFLGQKCQNTALPLLTQQQPSAAVTISNTNAGPPVRIRHERICVFLCHLTVLSSSFLTLLVM